MRDQRTGQMLGHSSPARVALGGVVGWLVPVPLSAASPDDPADVERRMITAADAAGVDCFGRPVGDHRAVQIDSERVLANRRVEGVRWQPNADTMHLVLDTATEGDLRSDGRSTRFAGQLRPNGALVAAHLLLLLWFAVVVLVARWVTHDPHRPDLGGIVFVFALGVLVATLTPVGIVEHVRTYRAHLRILRAGFGDRVRVGWRRPDLDS